MEQNRALIVLRDPLFFNLQEFNVDNVYDKIEAIPISRLVLVVASQSLDLGSLAYRVRDKLPGKAIRVVDVKTYEPERGRAISGWLVRNVEVYLSGRSLKTFASKFRALVKMVDKFDELCSDSFISCDNLNKSYESYRRFLHGMKHSDGTLYQTIDTRLGVASDIMDAFCKALNYRKYPVKKIQNETGRAKTAPTLSPQQDLVEESLALSYSLFSGISQLLSTNAAYPIELKLPKEKVWLFPIRQFCASKELLESAKPTLKRNILWNYREGRVNTPEEMEKRSVYKSVDISRKRYFLRSEYQKALENIDRCNADSNCIPRRRLMKIAQEAYIVIFVAVTGMNESVLRKLEFQPEWGDENFEGERGEIGFRGLKARAGNKWVGFKITTDHIKYFKRFIKLRDLICNEGDYRHLFVAMDSDGACLDEPIIEHTILDYYRRIRSFLYPSMRAISYRQWRKYKFDDVNQSEGLSVAAHSLQHTIGAATSSYMEQVPDDAMLEISSFIRQYDEGLQGHGRLNAFVETPAGSCEETGVPKMIEATGVFEPDCKSFLGCLFCEHFLLHTTEADVRKLLSMKYFLEKILPLSRSVSGFELTAGKTLQRIDEFVEAIKQASSEINSVVERVLLEVYKSQALSPYWQSKLYFLSRLDLI